MKPYRSPYEAYPFLSDAKDDLRCDFEILTDRMASMTGLLASLCPEYREELLKIDELIYHANPSLRTFFSLTEAEIEWLKEVQDLAARFSAQNGSIICRELLGLRAGASDPKPAERTAKYYHERCCSDAVESAAALMEEFIASHPLG